MEAAPILQIGLAEVIGGGAGMAVMYVAITKVIGPLVKRLPLPGNGKSTPPLSSVVCPNTSFSPDDKAKLSELHDMHTNSEKFNLPWVCQASENTPVLEEIRDGIKQLNTNFEVEKRLAERTG